MIPDDLQSELFAYTLSRADAAFVHQHALDAWVAQTADAATPPQRLVFALVGLLLHIEWAQSGRAVQRTHARLAAKRPAWPVFALPEFRGELTAADVLAAPPGDARDGVIRAWCASVWSAYAAQRNTLVAWLVRYGECP